MTTAKQPAAACSRTQEMPYKGACCFISPHALISNTLTDLEYRLKLIWKHTMVYLKPDSCLKWMWLRPWTTGGESCLTDANSLFSPCRCVFLFFVFFFLFCFFKKPSWVKYQGSKALLIDQPKIFLATHTCLWGLNLDMKDNLIHIWELIEIYDAFHDVYDA